MTSFSIKHKRIVKNMAKTKVKIQHAENGYVFIINGNIHIEKNLTEARRFIGELTLRTANEEDIDWLQFDYEYEVTNIEHNDNIRQAFESKMKHYGLEEN